MSPRATGPGVRNTGLIFGLRKIEMGLTHLHIRLNRALGFPERGTNLEKIGQIYSRVAFQLKVVQGVESALNYAEQDMVGDPPDYLWPELVQVLDLIEERLVALDNLASEEGVR
jgi:hypothetical protein